MQALGALLHCSAIMEMPVKAEEGSLRTRPTEVIVEKINADMDDPTGAFFKLSRVRRS